jgi:hypothetical protein
MVGFALANLATRPVPVGPAMTHTPSGLAYSIFTSGVYKATALDAAFPQEKPHFPEPDCAE